MTQTVTETAAPAGVARLDAQRYRTSLIENPDFVPPAHFEVPANLEQVPINPVGPTEIPVKTTLDYSKDDVEYKYKEFLPYNTLTSEGPLTPYDHVDRAAFADPSKKALLSAIPKYKDMTPNIGTEIWGLQLTKLTDQQKDELALWSAERGILVFRDQEFVDQGREWLKEYGSYFGRLHVHQWGVHPKDTPELTVVFRDSDKGSYFDNQKEGQLSTVAWHTDMSYEVNPPCTTFLSSLAGPQTGGDTLYLNAMTAYDRLSPTMQSLLEGLSALHSGTRQNLLSGKTNLARRPGIDTVHPVVRKHPVTGRKALWVNPEYTTKILGLRKGESDLLLNFLFDHMHKGLDFQTRVAWEDGTVVVYDNRMVQHSVTLDYGLENGVKRHLQKESANISMPSVPAIDDGVARQRVTINCDMGEGYGSWKMGPDEELMPLIDIANIACGFHGGDPVIMHKTIKLAKANNVPVGAHPSLPDREGFGRRHIDISPSDLFDQIVYQVGALVGMLKVEGMSLNHIKTHGYLWRMCEASQPHCDSVMRAALVFEAPMLIISGTRMETTAQAMGIKYIPEFYPDVHYNEEAKLMSILRDGRVPLTDIAPKVKLAVKDDQVLAKPTGEAVGLGLRGREFSCCVHSDLPRKFDLS
ncbi:lamB/YcsF family protein [Sarocladium implicatum]|nr:lamB/YcsF family protein [Sarocladium implicatum]